jgi:hypothetical protein
MLCPLMRDCDDGKHESAPEITGSFNHSPYTWAGGALALAGWTGFMRAAQALHADGSFSGFADLTPYAKINEFFAADLHARATREI